MTKTEVDRFRDVLTARVAELERFNRNRDGITIERSADQLDEIQAASQRALAVCKLDREYDELRNARAQNRAHGTQRRGLRSHVAGAQTLAFGVRQKPDPVTVGTGPDGQLESIDREQLPERIAKRVHDAALVERLKANAQPRSEP